MPLPLPANWFHYARVKSGGKEIRRSLKTKDRQVAKSNLSDLRGELGNVDLSVGRMSLAELGASYLRTIQRQKPKTIECKQLVVDRTKDHWPGESFRLHRVGPRPASCATPGASDCCFRAPPLTLNCCAPCAPGSAPPESGRCCPRHPKETNGGWGQCRHRRENRPHQRPGTGWKHRRRSKPANASHSEVSGLGPSVRRAQVESVVAQQIAGLETEIRKLKSEAEQLRKERKELTAQTAPG